MSIRKAISDENIEPGENAGDVNYHSEEVGESTPAASTPCYTDDSDSLKQYYRHLADSRPLTAQEELELWERIDSIYNKIRMILYRLAYILPEHMRLISECNAGNISDSFPVSVFKISETVKSSDSALLRLIPWKDEIAAHYAKASAVYSGTSKKKLELARIESVDLLMKYPVHGEKLFEWFNVAKVHLGAMHSAKEDGAGAKIKDLCSRVMMSHEELEETIATLEPVFAELEECRKLVVTVNLRLVVSIVRHYHVDNIQTGDLIQEGNIGLIKAIEKFDYKLGHRFATYATWWIKQAVSRAIASQARVIRLPAHMLVTISRINRAEQTFILRNGRDPSVDELAEILELSRERVNSIRKMACQVISLQAPLAGQDGVALENLISEGESDDPVKSLTFKLMKARLEQAMDLLSEREQQILKMRFGFGAETPKTLVEVSKMFNLTRERIRQIEVRAIKKLRAPELAAYFEDYCS